jgi:hypothetical protein
MHQQKGKAMTSWTEANTYMNDRDDDPEPPDVVGMQERIRQLECQVEDLERIVDAAKATATETVWVLTPAARYSTSNVYGRCLSEITWRECRPLLKSAEQFIALATGMDHEVTR